jgi:hypothetical protein
MEKVQKLSNSAFVIVFSDHVELMPSKEDPLTETCKGNKYLQIESH